MRARSFGRRRTHAAAVRIWALALAGWLPAVILFASPAPAGIPATAGTPATVISDIPGDTVDVAARVAWSEDRRESGPDLLLLLADPEASVRARAARAIGRIGRVADVWPLAPLLHDPDTPVRREAAFALGEIEDSSAAAVLEAHVLSKIESDADTRALCLEGLGKLRAGAAAIGFALDDPDPAVQVAALHAAWRVPGTEPVARAVELSLGEDPAVRRAAACCLMRHLGVQPSGRTAVPEIVQIGRAHV
jgi:HEAT repeat protein